MTTSTRTLPAAHAGRVVERPDPEVPQKATRRRFTAAYKLSVLERYDAATEPGVKGALLRGRACTPRTSWLGATPASRARWRGWTASGAVSDVTRWRRRTSGCAAGPRRLRPTLRGHAR